MSRYIDLGTDQASLAFRLRLPEDNQVAPIVMLHGLGGDENVMWGLESALPQAGMVVAPRAPHEQRQGEYSWNPIIKAWPPLVSEFAEAVDLLESLLDYLELQYAFRRDRMVLMGFSNGTAMSFAASMTPMSQSPAGIIAISGHLPEGDLSPLRGIPVYWGHGTRDTFIPIDIARSDAERLRQAEVPVTFCEARVGHKLGAQCLDNLRRWLSVEFPVPEAREERTP
ncbi:MAG: alpha/beta hydrolase [Anaerolineales bacterium]